MVVGNIEKLLRDY